MARVSFMQPPTDNLTYTCIAAAVICLTTLIVNIFVMPSLQQKLSAQGMLQIDYAVLIVAYFLFTFEIEHWPILLAIPTRVCLSLCSQRMSYRR